MRLNPITITIEEEPGAGWLLIRVVVKNKNGESHCGKTITSYAVGRKVQAISDVIRSILTDYRNDGTLEEELSTVALANDAERSV